MVALTKDWISVAFIVLTIFFSSISHAQYLPGGTGSFPLSMNGLGEILSPPTDVPPNENLGPISDDGPYYLKSGEEPINSSHTVIHQHNGILNLINTNIPMRFEQNSLWTGYTSKILPCSWSSHSETEDDCMNNGPMFPKYSDVLTMNLYLDGAPILWNSSAGEGTDPDRTWLAGDPSLWGSYAGAVSIMGPLEWDYSESDDQSYIVCVHQNTDRSRSDYCTVWEAEKRTGTTLYDTVGDIDYVGNSHGLIYGDSTTNHLANIAPSNKFAIACQFDGDANVELLMTGLNNKYWKMEDGSSEVLETSYTPAVGSCTGYSGTPTGNVYSLACGNVDGDGDAMDIAIGMDKGWVWYRRDGPSATPTWCYGALCGHSTNCNAAEYNIYDITIQEGDTTSGEEIIAVGTCAAMSPALCSYAGADAACFEDGGTMCQYDDSNFKAYCFGSSDSWYHGYGSSVDGWMLDNNRYYNEGMATAYDGPPNWYTGESQRVGASLGTSYWSINSRATVAATWSLREASHASRLWYTWNSLRRVFEFSHSDLDSDGEHEMLAAYDYYTQSIYDYNGDNMATMVAQDPDYNGGDQAVDWYLTSSNSSGARIPSGGAFFTDQKNSRQTFFGGYLITRNGEVISRLFPAYGSGNLQKEGIFAATMANVSEPTVSGQMVYGGVFELIYVDHANELIVREPNPPLGLQIDVGDDGDVDWEDTSKYEIPDGGYFYATGGGTTLGGAGFQTHYGENFRSDGLIEQNMSIGNFQSEADQYLAGCTASGGVCTVPIHATSQEYGQLNIRLNEPISYDYFLEHPDDPNRVMQSRRSYYLGGLCTISICTGLTAGQTNRRSWYFNFENAPAALHSMSVAYFEMDDGASSCWIYGWDGLSGSQLVTMVDGNKVCSFSPTVNIDGTGESAPGKNGWYEYDTFTGQPVQQYEFSRSQATGRTNYINGPVYAQVDWRLRNQNDDDLHQSMSSITWDATSTLQTGGWTCEGGTCNGLYGGTITDGSEASGLTPTPIVYKNNVILAWNGTSWSQDTSGTTYVNGNTYSKGRVQVNNTGSTAWTNVVFDNAQYPLNNNVSRSTWSCTTSAGSIASVPGNSLTTDDDDRVFCSKSNVIAALEGADWRQDGTQPNPQMLGPVYIEGKVRANNTDDSVTYNSVQYTSAINDSSARAGWGCSVEAGTFGTVPNKSIVTSVAYSVDCDRPGGVNSVLQPMEAQEWRQVETKVSTDDYLFIEGKIAVNNTDIINLTNVQFSPIEAILANESRKFNGTGGGMVPFYQGGGYPWNCSMGSGSIPFSSGNNTSVDDEYSIQCNRTPNNIINKYYSFSQNMSEVTTTGGNAYLFANITIENNDPSVAYMINTTVSKPSGWNWSNNMSHVLVNATNLSNTTGYLNIYKANEITLDRKNATQYTVNQTEAGYAYLQYANVTAIINNTGSYNWTDVLYNYTLDGAVENISNKEGYLNMTENEVVEISDVIFGSHTLITKEIEEDSAKVDTTQQPELNDTQEWYYWNLTVIVNNTYVANFTDVFYRCELVYGGDDNYTGSVVNGTIPSLNVGQYLNASCAYRTLAITKITEDANETQPGEKVEQKIWLYPPNNTSPTFVQDNYDNIKIAGELPNATFSAAAWYLYECLPAGNPSCSWSDVTNNPSYSFSTIGSTYSFKNPTMSWHEYILVGVKTIPPVPPAPTGGGGGGGLANFVINPRYVNLTAEIDRPADLIIEGNTCNDNYTIINIGGKPIRITMTVYGKQYATFNSKTLLSVEPQAFDLGLGTVENLHICAKWVSGSTVPMYEAGIIAETFGKSEEIKVIIVSPGTLAKGVTVEEVEEEIKRRFVGGTPEQKNIISGFSVIAILTSITGLLLITKRGPTYFG